MGAANDARDGAGGEARPPQDAEAEGTVEPGGLPDEDEARRGGNVPPPPEACSWALLAHLSYVAAPILGPALVLAFKRDVHPFVEDQAREALNFQVCVIIAALVCVPLIFACGLGLLGLLVLGIGALVYTIMAAMAAYRGEQYRYPYIRRLFT